MSGYHLILLARGDQFLFFLIFLVAELSIKFFMQTRMVNNLGFCRKKRRKIVFIEIKWKKEVIEARN